LLSFNERDSIKSETNELKIELAALHYFKCIFKASPVKPKQ